MLFINWNLLTFVSIHTEDFTAAARPVLSVSWMVTYATLPHVPLVKLSNIHTDFLPRVMVLLVVGFILLQTLQRQIGIIVVLGIYITARGSELCY